MRWWAAGVVLILSGIAACDSAGTGRAGRLSPDGGDAGDAGTVLDGAPDSDAAPPPDASPPPDAAPDASTPPDPLAPWRPSSFDYYVAPTGSDQNDGRSAAKAFRTIAHAASVVAAGEAVDVAPGDYPETLTTSASGSAGAPIVYFSEKRFGARIDASGSNTAWQNNGDYVNIVGFDITGSDYLGIANEGSHVNIVANDVHDLATPSCNSPNGGAGIDSENYSAVDVNIIGNLVHDIRPAGTCGLIQGIYHSHRQGLIQNNIVYHIAAYGIHLWHAATDITITNNLSFSNGSGGITVGAGDSPGGVTASNIVVANNIVVDNAVYGIQEHGATSGNRFIDNIVHGNGTNISLINGTETGTLAVDPELVDYQPDGTGDYHPTPSSPAVDAGTSDGAPAWDYDGNARSDGLIDVGPYELQ